MSRVTPAQRDACLHLAQHVVDSIPDPSNAAPIDHAHIARVVASLAFSEQARERFNVLVLDVRMHIEGITGTESTRGTPTTIEKIVALTNKMRRESVRRDGLTEDTMEMPISVNQVSGVLAALMLDPGLLAEFELMMLDAKEYAKTLDGEASS